MKREFVFIVLLSISIHSYSQINKLSIGIIGGPGLSILYSGHKANNIKSACKVAGAAGFTLQYAFNQHLAIYSNIIFERKGGYDLGPSPLINTVKLNYLTLPILIKASVGKKISFFGIAGLYVSVLPNAELNSDNPNIPIRDKQTNITSQVSKADIGACAGIGLKVPIKKYFAFTIEERNSLGFLTVFHMQDGIASRNFSSCLVLGFSYEMHKKVSKNKSRRI